MFGGFTTWRASRENRVAPAELHQSGRDQALIDFIKCAKKSVLVRTDSLTLVPVGNELGLAQQRGVPVTMDFPVEAGEVGRDTRLVRVLIELGATASFKSDSTWNYSGAYVVVDGSRYFYSASPLDQCPKGARVSFVVGPLKEAKQ
jgi:hypothetical protein